MGIVRGLDAIRKHVDDVKEGFEDRRKVEYLLSKDNLSKPRKIRFAQELDEGADNYNEDYGIGLVVPEHHHPDGDDYPAPPGSLFWLRLVDRTEEDGQDWCAEQGWKLKATLYVNVVDVDTGEVFIFSRSPFSQLSETILETAAERGTITDTVWKVSKSKNYNLSFADVTDEPLDIDPEDLYDIEEEVIRNVPYEEQEELVRNIEKAKYGNDEEDESDEDEDSGVW